MLDSAFAIFFACESNNELKRLKSYLNSFSYTIEDYKVISFVPVDGCGSCINPSLEYANKSDKNMLLELTSIFRKSIEFSIDIHDINKTDLIFDSKNLAAQYGFVSNIAPYMKYLKLILAILIIIFSCNNGNRNSKLSFILEATKDSICIKLGPKEQNHSVCNQFFCQNDTNYLAVLNRNRNSIYFYNLHKRILSKEINIKKEGINSFPGFISFIAKKLDTIILISNYPGKIGIINGNGEIINSILIDKDDNGKNLRPALPYFGQKGLLSDGILYLLQACNTTGTNNGIFTLGMQKISDIAISINLHSGKVKSLSLKYPLELVNKDIFNMENYWELGYNGDFIYGSSLLNSFYLTKDFNRFTKLDIETDYNFKLPENLSKYGSDLDGLLKYTSTRDNILSLFYDDFRKCYYLLVQRRLEEVTIEGISRTNFVYPNCIIIILDKNLRHMGDVFFPKNTYSFKDMFIAKEGLYISEDHVNNPTYSEDVMRFRLFKLKQIQQ